MTKTGMKPLCTQTLCIRSYQTDDMIAFIEAVNESVSSVGKWLEWCHEDYTQSEAETWFELCRKNNASGLAYEYGIFSNDSGLFYGGIGINNINRAHNYANIGYWMRPSQQGKGIATQAVTEVVRYGFGELKFTRLEIVAAVGNTASRRVAEKSGAQFECIARNRLMIHGKSHDAAMYSLVPEQPGF
jgi:RimJ/RimL family protein N-acetyltransferase